MRVRRGSLILRHVKEHEVRWCVSPPPGQNLTRGETITHRKNARCLNEKRLLQIIYCLKKSIVFVVVASTLLCFFFTLSSKIEVNIGALCGNVCHVL